MIPPLRGTSKDSLPFGPYERLRIVAENPVMTKPNRHLLHTFFTPASREFPALLPEASPLASGGFIGIVTLRRQEN